MAQPHPEGMPERIRARLGSAASGLPEPFDGTDPRHVDQAAAALIKRFYDENDSKSFELLVELTLPILNGAAEDVAREEGVAAGAQTLLTGTFTQIFVSLRPPVGLTDAPFLGWVVGQVRERAKARVVALASRKIAVAETGGALPDGNAAANTAGDEAGGKPGGKPGTTTDAAQATGAESGGAAADNPGPNLTKLAEAVSSSGALDLTPLGLTMSGIVEIVFHRLPLEHRRILRCVEVAQMSDETAALFLGIPADQVQDRNAQARGELQARVRAVLETLSDALTCALHGKALADVSAEQLAEHLVGCETCTSNVELMHALGDVGGWLTSVREKPNGASRVEQVLAEANGRGTEELVALLFEMHRACLAMIEGYASRASLRTQPEPPSELRARAGELAQRQNLDRAQPLGDGTAPLESARRCVELMELVAPRRPRTIYARGNVRRVSGEHEDALKDFELIANSLDVPPKRRSIARVNMLWCLLHLCRYEDVLKATGAMLRHGDLPKWAAIYRVWVAGHLQDADLFASSAKIFCEADPGGEPAEWWSTLVATDVEWLASQLSLTPAAVSDALRGGQS